MKYKILIIDDEEMILSMMEKCLGEEFSVYTAENAKKALELLNVIPDIILLDINMPEMDGLELCQLIRGHISCPIIFLTARVTERDVIKGLSVGGDDYITKPFRMDELLARISAHLRREERKGTAENLRFDEELIIDYNSRTVFYGKEQLDFNKVVGGVGIADDEERRRPSVPQLVKLHLVIAHNLPELRDVKWGQPRTA